MRRYLILYVIGLHYLWASVLILYPNTSRGLTALVGFQRWSHFFSPMAVGVFIFIVATLALIALTSERVLPPKINVSLLMPQYLIALFSAVSSIRILIVGKVLVSGHYQPISFSLALIFVGPLIISGIFHTMAILERFSETTTSELTRLRLRIAELEFIESGRNRCDDDVR